jgi:hypothetical protein
MEEENVYLALNTAYNGDIVLMGDLNTKVGRNDVDKHNENDAHFVEFCGNRKKYFSA